MWIFSRRLRRSRRGMQQAALFRRERQVGDGCEIIAVIVVLLFVFRLRKSARSARDLLFSLCKLLEYSYVFILPQIAQITQRNTASCIISQRKTGWGWL